MDEILASIRRIIENSDERPETPKADDAPSSGVSRLRPSADTGPMLRVATERGVERAVEAQAPEPVPSAEQPVFSSRDEDDLARRLREELEAEAFGDWPTLDEVSSETAEPSRSAAKETFAASSLRIERDASKENAMQGLPADLLKELEAKADGLDRGEGAARAETPAPFNPANSDSPRMHEFRAAVLDDAGQEARGSDAPLISGRTGDLVGASFDELARAIREGELRSLEDMAQEMLRPMLQDWLDDNLPKLVERLVREEIERVARGGRR